MSMESIELGRLTEELKDLKFTLVATSLFLAYHIMATTQLQTPDMEAIKQRWEEMLST